MNPELRRNLWLELTTHRLVAMPAVLILVFAMFIAADTLHWPAVLFSTATGLFVMLVHLWGARQASEAVTEEVRDRTWDSQRLSALAPWQMAWGKLLGATAFTWFGGAICLAAIAVAAAAGVGRDNVGWLVLAMVASAVALHGALLAASLQAARKDSRLSYRIGTLMMLPALLTGGIFVFMASRSDMGSLPWRGGIRDAIEFAALSSVAFAAWGVLATYRQMCSELRKRTLPWAWPAFALFLAFYISGFAPAYVDGRSVFIAAGLYTAIALTYYALFTDYITAMTLRRTLIHMQTRQWRRVVEEMPMLVTTLLLAVAFACAAPWAVSQLPFGNSFPKLAAYPIATLFFLVRDVGLLVFFTLGPKPKRVEGVTLLYIVLLAWVIPGLLRAVGLTWLATAIAPMGHLEAWQAALVVAAQAAVVWAGVVWRWHRAFREGAKV